MMRGLLIIPFAPISNQGRWKSTPKLRQASEAPVRSLFVGVGVPSLVQQLPVPHGVEVNALHDVIQSAHVVHEQQQKFPIIVRRLQDPLFRRDDLSFVILELRVPRTLVPLTLADLDELRNREPHHALSAPVVTAGTPPAAWNEVLIHALQQIIGEIVVELGRVSHLHDSVPLEALHLLVRQRLPLAALLVVHLQPIAGGHTLSF
mmetsp:Transcript_46644/g.98978  ORF Transcript_46644/g.98978 Transcript_46644/m.98978 type:complete len:205 (+) Transcript_46644:217-831(+)